MEEASKQPDPVNVPDASIPDPALVRGYTELCFHRLPNHVHPLKQCLLDRLAHKPAFILPVEEVPKDPQLAELHQHLHAERAHLLQQRDRVFSALNGAGVDVMLIKGINMEEMYPQGLLRRSNDMDLVVRDHAAFWHAAETVEPMGYWPYGVSYSKDVWDQYVEHGFGQFACPEPDEPTLEIAFGGFSEAVAGISSHWLWAHSTERTLGTIQYRKPDQVASLALLLTESYTRDQVTGRDIFDFFLLTNDVSDETRKAMLEMIREFSFTALASRFVRPLAKYLGADLPKWLAPFSSGYDFDFPWALRRNLVYCLPYVTRRLGVFRGLKRVYDQYIDEHWNMFSHYEWNRLVRLRGMLSTPAKRYAKGQYVILVLLSSGTRGSVKWYQEGRYVFLRTPVGLYLASSHSLETDPELDAAQAVFNQAAVE